MRANIDLTENRDFSENSGMRISRAVLKQFRSIRLPWKSITMTSLPSDIDTQMINRWVIPLGNEADREVTKEMIEEESGEYCQCCGTPIKVFPYKVNDGLCRRCSERLEYHDKDKRIPWRTRNNIPRNILNNFF